MEQSVYITRPIDQIGKIAKGLFLQIGVTLDVKRFHDKDCCHSRFSTTRVGEIFKSF